MPTRCEAGNCNSRGDRAGEVARTDDSDDAESQASAARETTGMLRRGCGWCSLSGGGQERSDGERHKSGGYEDVYSWACGGETADEVRLTAGKLEDAYDDA